MQGGSLLSVNVIAQQHKLFVVRLYYVVQISAVLVDTALLLSQIIKDINPKSSIHVRSKRLSTLLIKLLVR
jgi:hypothetical protein